MRNWTKKKPNPMLRSAGPTASPFDGLNKEARIAAMKAAIQEVIDAKLNKGNN